MEDSEMFLGDSRAWSRYLPAAWREVADVPNGAAFPKQLNVNRENGIDPVSLRNWSVDELVTGWICELCDVDLEDVINGRDAARSPITTTTAWETASRMSLLGGPAASHDLMLIRTSGPAPCTHPPCPLGGPRRSSNLRAPGSSSCSRDIQQGAA
jgi:hypothetical protein